jgi:hypothetical protein
MGRLSSGKGGEVQGSQEAWTHSGCERMSRCEVMAWDEILAWW